MRSVATISNCPSTRYTSRTLPCACFSIPGSSVLRITVSSITDFQGSSIGGVTQIITRLRHLSNNILVPEVPLRMHVAAIVEQRLRQAAGTALPGAGAPVVEGI